MKISKKYPPVSIIIPCHNNDKTIGRVIGGALSQKYSGKEIIIVDDLSTDKSPEIISKLKKKIKIITNEKNLGLAGSLNKGIKKARGEIIVTLQGDCIPQNRLWLSKLLEPFKNESVVATCSRVHNPIEIWNKSDPLTKDLLIQEKGTYTPKLDEKGCAYRKKTLEKVGLFDDKHFRLAGEDFDMFAKMEGEGKIVFGIEPFVIHEHFLDKKGFYRRWRTWSTASGVLFRIHGRKVDGWAGTLKRTIFPVWGILKGIKTRAEHTNKSNLIMTYILLNLIHTKNFIRGYLLNWILRTFFLEYCYKRLIFYQANGQQNFVKILRRIYLLRRNCRDVYF